MTDRSAFDGARQRAVIRKLQRNAGLEATDLAQAVNLSYPQLRRYAYGKVPLRSFQIPLFAKAFGVDPLDLAAELGGYEIHEDRVSNPDAPEWTFRDALRGHVPEDMIEKMAPTWEGRPLLSQRDAVEAILEMAEELRRDRTKPIRHANGN